MTDPEQTLTAPPRRLCSEIQLFDLCDLDSCRCRNGRFCSDAGLLARFERISEEEDRASVRYISEECDDDEDIDAYDDEYDGDAYEDCDDDENGAWEDDE